MKNKVLTKERANIITGILNEDVERANELLALTPEGALEKINGGLGYDFSVEEIIEYGKAVTRLPQYHSTSNV